MTGFVKGRCFMSRGDTYLFISNYMFFAKLPCIALGTGGVKSRGLSLQALRLHTAGLVAPFCNISLLFGRYLPWRTTMLSVGRRHKPCQSYCAFSSPSSMWSWQSAVQPSSIFWFWFTARAAAKCAGHTVFCSEKDVFTPVLQQQRRISCSCSVPVALCTPTQACMCTRAHTHKHTHTKHQLGISQQ